MLIEFQGSTATDLYLNGLAKFRAYAEREDTRNGPAMVMPEVTAFTLLNPQTRVLIDPVRDCNPFFHVMEFIWMMAGRNDSSWISQFNSRMTTFANDGRLNAAYGHRWRTEYGLDQIAQVIQILRSDPTSRQAVLSMWDPYLDNLEGVKDRACNTTIMLRNQKGFLNMLVCNRSNDFIWGSLGANLVHITMLHELIAHFSRLSLGKYKVVSNNLHLYNSVPNYEKIWGTRVSPDVYQGSYALEMFTKESKYDEFIRDCMVFCNAEEPSAYLYRTPWMNKVALPIYGAYMDRKMGIDDGRDFAEQIAAKDWREACLQWIQRRNETSSSVTSTEP